MHLALQEDSSYLDYMDERSYYEAVGVHAEWLMWDALGRGSSLPFEIWEQLDAWRRQRISPDELAQWLTKMRGYEFRLRTVRLLADVLTMGEQLPFQRVVDACTRQTGVSPEDAEPEVRKYYHFTGLGGMYTLGYRELLDRGVASTHAALMANGMPLRTWQQVHSLPTHSYGA